MTEQFQAEHRHMRAEAAQWLQSARNWLRLATFFNVEAWRRVECYEEARMALTMSRRCHEEAGALAFQAKHNVTIPY